MPLWQARKIIQDAFTKRIQDTLIVTLETKIDTLESYLASREKYHNQILTLEREKLRAQAELITAETSLAEYYSQKYKKTRKQRNATVMALGVIVLYNVAKNAKLFKPP